ncbi:Proliferating cell nuclear antigen, partial [Nosema bombycis CQ1]
MFELEINHQTKEEKNNNFPGGKIGILKKILESISEIVDHVEIKTKEHGLEMQVMDSMHVVLIDVLLDKALFDSYRCDRDVTLGIKIKNLLQILKDITFTQDSVLNISCEDTPNKLAIQFKQPNFKLNWDLSLYSFD